MKISPQSSICKYGKCFHCCVMCCHLWTSWVVDAQNLMRTHFIVTAMLSVVLQDMAFITVGYCGKLAEMHISVARDMVFRHMTYIAFITKYFVRSYVRHAQSLNVILTRVRRFTWNLRCPMFRYLGETKLMSDSNVYLVIYLIWPY